MSSKIQQNRETIKLIQKELIYQIQKFDCPNYYGKKALKGCETIESLANQLVLAVVELTINLEEEVDCEL